VAFLGPWVEGDMLSSLIIKNQLLVRNQLRRAVFYVLIITIGVLVGLAIPAFLEMVVVLGHNISQPDIESDYVFAIVWAVVLGGSILAWPVSSTDKGSLLWVWLAKVMVTLGFMLLYEANYSSLDAYSYFGESAQRYFPFEGIGLGAGTQNINALVWLHNQVLPHSYHALKISFSMIGLVAMYLFYRASAIFLRHEDRRVLYALALFPSILFWSSIIGKDPIVLLGVALYAYGVVAWYQFKKVRHMWVLLLGILVTTLIRVWLGPILLAPLAIFALRGIKGVIPRMVFIAFTVIVFLFSMKQFMVLFRMETAEDVFATANIISRSWAHGGSGQELNADFTKITELAGFVPLGIFTALFRPLPLPGEIVNMFGLLAGTENLFLLLLFGWAIKRMNWRDLKEPIVLWATVLVLIWAAVYGFVSYQNLGSAVRFKLQILPVLLGLLLYLSRTRPNILMPER
jgi:hypothetical protein